MKSRKPCPDGSSRSDALPGFSPEFLVDLNYVSQYNNVWKILTKFHKIFPFDGYDDMIPEDDSGRKFRFRKRFNGTRNSMDTIWEFIGTSTVKFSLDFKNWDFPDDADRFAFDFQVAWIAPLVDYRQPPECYQRNWENRAGSVLADKSILVRAVILVEVCALLVLNRCLLHRCLAEETLASLS
jgi:hypothetical protein